jgi:PPP family 3-phenylpropionic acid transporter
MRWLAALYAAYFGFVGLYSPYFGPYLKSLGHSVELIAWSLAMMQAMRFFGPQFWGWLADSSKERVKWLRVGCALGVVSASVFFLNDKNPMWVIVFAVLLNSVLSGVVPLSDAHAMQVCGKDIGMYGRVRLWGSLGFIFSVMGFGQWGVSFGLSDYPWFVVGTLLLTLLCTFYMQEPSAQHIAEHEQHQVTHFKGLLMAPALRWFWCASFCMIAAHGALYGFYSLYLQHHGYGTDVIGALWTVGVVAEVIFFWFQGSWFGRFSTVAWLRYGALACMLRFAVIASVPASLPVLLIAQCAHALTFAAHHTASMAWLRTHCGPGMLARGQATYTTIAYGLGGFLGTGLAGRLWTGVDPSAAFVMAAGFGLATYFCVLKMRRMA